LGDQSKCGRLDWKIKKKLNNKPTAKTGIYAIAFATDLSYECNPASLHYVDGKS